jgi:hypothetical protein
VGSIVKTTMQFAPLTLERRRPVFAQTLGVVDRG